MDIKSRLEIAYGNRSTLITGGASFIGSHLAELLVDAGAFVTVADDLSSGRLENLTAVQSRVRFLKGDLRKPEFAKIACNKQDIIFHLAASHGGRGYIDTHPVECTNNMLLDHVVFAAAAGAGTSKIIFASSACVYPTNLQSDKNSRLLLKEADANFEEPGKAFADGEYGWAKLMGELQLRAFCKQFGLSGIVCRIFTAYGERENESHAVTALIAKAAARLRSLPNLGRRSPDSEFHIRARQCDWHGACGRHHQRFRRGEHRYRPPPHDFRFNSRDFLLHAMGTKKNSKTIRQACRRQQSSSRCY